MHDTFKAIEQPGCEVEVKVDDFNFPVNSSDDNMWWHVAMFDNDLLLTYSE